MQLSRHTFEDFKVRVWLDSQARSRECDENQPRLSLKRKRSPSPPPTTPPWTTSTQYSPKQSANLDRDTQSLEDAEVRASAPRSKRRTSPRKQKPQALPQSSSREQQPNNAEDARAHTEVLRRSSTGNARDGTRGRAASLDPTPPASTSAYAAGLSLDSDTILSPSSLPSRSNAQTTSSRHRSTSPVKTVQDLLMAQPPIRFCEGVHGGETPLDAALRLHQLVGDAAGGFASMPQRFKVEAQSLSQYATLHDVYFCDAPNQTATTQSVAEEEELWQAVKKIYTNAARCSESGTNESGWGERVYSRVFDAAFECARYSDDIEWHNITTARIRPLTLVPRNSGKVFASKLVDYAIVLRCQPDIHRRILSLLNQHDHDHPAINHTYCAPVRYQPITVNIEVKAPGGGDSMVQHMVWVGAHLRKLGQLANGKVDICIPMVSVQGHSWRIHYAYQKEENGVIVVWGNAHIGNTSSILGIYQIIAALRLLGDWSRTEYTRWFSERVLGRG